MDEDFIELARRGDSEAFHQIIISYHPLIWRMARTLLNNPAMAEDACQEIWIDAWRGLPSFTAGHAFRPWLLTIAAHRCHKLLRQRYQSQESFAATLMPDIADPATPLADIFHSETRQELYRAITLLPCEQQQVITLRYFADLDLAEIAAVLNVPIGTVKSRMHRAMVTLRHDSTKIALDLGGYMR